MLCSILRCYASVSHISTTKIDYIKLRDRERVSRSNETGEWDGESGSIKALKSCASHTKWISNLMFINIFVYLWPNDWRHRCAVNPSADFIVHVPRFWYVCFPFCQSVRARYIVSCYRCWILFDAEYVLSVIALSVCYCFMCLTFCAFHNHVIGGVSFEAMTWEHRIMLRHTHSND